MRVDLVKAATADGIRLDGILQRAAEPRFDFAAICLHGAGSNFYAGGLFEELTPPLLDAGVSVLRVNTRGRDGYYIGRSAIGLRRLGAAYETVSDGTLDIAAWLDRLEDEHFSRAVLVGHSLGAIKAVYAQAVKPDPRVVGIVAISPPRLSRSAFQWGPKSAEFGDLLREAQQLVEQGRPQAVLESTFPFPMLITAEAFLDKYGGETYNVVELSRQLAVPTTFVFGQRELEQGGVAFAGLDEAIRAAAGPEQSITVQVVKRADHFYIGCYEALADKVLAALNGMRG